VVYRNNEFLPHHFAGFFNNWEKQTTIKELTWAKNDVGLKYKDPTDALDNAAKAVVYWLGDPAVKLGIALKDDPRMVKLELEELNIGDEFVQNMIANGFGENKSLQSFRFAKNELTDEGVEKLAEVCKQHPTLTRLDLDGNLIEDDGVLALCKLVKANKRIEFLGLRSNKFKNRGLEAIIDLLSANTSLQELDLRRNLLGDEGCRKLAKGLSLNSTLKGLDLSSNRIRDAGARSIAEAISHCKSLEVLTLAVNAIENEGASVLAEAVQSHPALTELDLRMNSFGKAAYEKLADAYEANSNFKRLYISTSRVEGWEALDRIQAKLGDDPGKKSIS